MYPRRDSHCRMPSTQRAKAIESDPARLHFRDCRRRLTSFVGLSSDDVPSQTLPAVQWEDRQGISGG